MTFDAAVPKAGTVNGRKVLAQVACVPGRVFKDAARKRLLRQARAVVFVADTRPERFEATIEAMDNLRFHFEESRRSLRDVPMVIQYNIWKGGSAPTTAALRKELNPDGLREIEAVATTGTGVMETFDEICRTLVTQASASSGT